MKAKNAMYAAVGAPIAAARALNARLETLREELESRGEGLSDRAQQLLEEWTREGRQAMEKVSEGKVVDEFASKVDFDQARDQVGKLREQLEEMLATWRSSFRPEAGDQAPARPDPASKAERARTEKATGGGTEVEIPEEPVSPSAAESDFPTEAEMLLPDQPAADQPSTDEAGESERDTHEQ